MRLGFILRLGLPILLHPSTVSAGTDSQPGSVSLDVDDRFAYVVNVSPVKGFGCSVAQFRRGPETWQVTSLNHSLVQTAQNPRSCTCSLRIIL